MSLNHLAIARIFFLSSPDLIRPMQPNLVAYEAMSFREQLVNDAASIWGSLQRCLSGYDPSRHAPGSDEEYRNRIAIAAIDGAPNREEFEGRLREAIELYLPELQSRRDKFLSMLPSDLIAVCDARGAWGNRELLLRMNETTNIVSQARTTVRKG